MTFPKARFNLPNGDLLTVWAAPKYVLFVIVQPGRQPFRTEIYIPWAQMLKLLPWLVKAARRRTGSEYPPVRIARYLEQEQALDDDLRRQRRERRQVKRRPRR